MPFDANVATLEPSSCASRPSCEFCPAASRCAMGGLRNEVLAQWNALVQCHVSLNSAGKALFTAGDATTAFYVVRAGCLKTITVDDEGHERVRGFYLPGDMIGLDALGSERYPSTAVAVSASQVCRIPKAVAMQRISDSPALAQRLLQRLSHDLAQAQALAGEYTAEQRVAAFLLNMNQRLDPMPGVAAKLPMSRGDIANYLRLATETVCRVMTRFAAKGLIHTEDRKVRILNGMPMRMLAAPVGLTSPMRAAA
jgi:CRP/FNR family transcriptional regulator